MKNISTLSATELLFQLNDKILQLTIESALLAEILETLRPIVDETVEHYTSREGLKQLDAEVVVRAGKPMPPEQLCAHVQRWLHQWKHIKNVHGERE